MANRDTTSTPYKLSSDGLAYFNHPTGNASVATVADYATLRTKGSADAINGMIHVTNASIKGSFICVPSGTLQLTVDDGGFCISGTGGSIWFRFMGFNCEPIQLDWYNSANGHNFTPALLAAINTGLFPTKFSFKAPSTSYSQLDKITVNALEFHIKAGSSPHEFRQGSGTNATTSWQTIVTTSNVIVIDAGIKFLGDQTKGRLTGRTGKNPVTGADDASYIGPADKGLIEINSPGLITADINCDVSYPIGCGLRMGSTPSTSVLNVSGTWTEAAIEGGTSSVGTINLNTIMNDPKGASIGLDPVDPSAPTTGYDYYQRSRPVGCNLAMARKINGRMAGRYGGARGSATAGLNDGMGSQAAPFTIAVEDMGYVAADNVGRVPTYYNDGIGKFDGLNNGSNPVYLNLEFTGRNYRHREFSFEATPDSPGSHKYVNNCHLKVIDTSSPTWVQRNNQMPIGSSTGDPNDWGQIEGSSWDGTFGGMTIVEGNTYKNIFIIGAGYHTFCMELWGIRTDDPAPTPSLPGVFTGLTITTAAVNKHASPAYPMLLFKNGTWNIDNFVQQASTVNSNQVFIEFGSSSGAFDRPSVFTFTNASFKPNTLLTRTANSISSGESLQVIINGIDITSLFPYRTP